MGRIRNFSILISVLFITGCIEKQKDLELVILNKQFYARCPTDNCNDSQTFEAWLNGEIPVNVVEFKIINHSDFNYLFIPTCLECFGGTGFYEFPRAGAGLSLRNVLINHSLEQTESMYSKTIGGGRIGLDTKTDSIVENYLKNIQEFRNTFQSMISNIIQENTVIIPAKSTFYFKTFFTIPYNQTYGFQAYELNAIEELSLNKNEKYVVSLYFNSKFEDVKKYMSKSMIRTIEENGFKTFDGELISTNEVPLIFK